MSSNNNSLFSFEFLSERISLWMVVLVFVIAQTLGTIGYLQYPHGDETVTFSNAFYHSAQLFLLHAPHFERPVPLTLEFARWLALISIVLAAFNIVYHLWIKESKIQKLRKSKNHAIVCGLGRRGMAVLEKLHENKISVVAIDIQPNAEIEERLKKMHIPLITGDATRKEILQQAKIEKAEKLFSLCPDDMLNISVAIEALKFQGNNIPAKQFFVHVNDAELRIALKNNHEDLAKSIHFIDAYEPEAINLLSHGLPLDHDGISPDSKQQVHLLILGFGCMGRTIAVKAAQLGQFANRKKIKISVIDHHAELNRSALLFHHPYIEEVADFKFYQQEVLSPETRALVEKICNEPDTLVNVVFCFDNPTIVCDVVLNLLPLFNRKNVRVAVRLNESEDLRFLIASKKPTNDKEEEKYPNSEIRYYGLDKSYENLIDINTDVTEKFAKDIHKAYIEMITEEFKYKPNELDEKKKSGELNEWNSLPEDFKESNRQQAVHINFKLRACGYEMVEYSEERPAIMEFPPNQLDILAIMEHDRWVAERKVNNWKYGKVSDKPNRINKNITDWDKLTEEVKEYDYVTVRRIPGMLKLIGKKMVEKEILNENINLKCSQ